MIIQWFLRNLLFKVQDVYYNYCKNPSVIYVFGIWTIIGTLNWDDRTHKQKSWLKMLKNVKVYLLFIPIFIKDNFRARNIIIFVSRDTFTYVLWHVHRGNPIHFVMTTTQRVVPYGDWILNTQCSRKQRGDRLNNYAFRADRIHAVIIKNILRI